MSRFWPQGLPIQVTTDALATPVVIRWGAQRHTVRQVIERWRIDEGWWRKRAWREYFTLLTGSGLLVQVYHDIARGEWRLQRLYD